MINNPIFQIIMDTIPNPAIITDGRQLVRANKCFLDFFNYKDLNLFIENNSCVCRLFIDNSEYFSLNKINKTTLWTDYIYKEKNKQIVLIKDQNSQERVFELSINKLENDTSKYIVLFTDITIMRTENKVLEKMAYYDHLTQIYNRQIFNKLYIKELENFKRYKDELSIIMLDIDHFKNVNDQYGHDVGDQVLVSLSKLISNNLRLNDIFARWGGEEFMILLPRTNVNAAYNKAQELRALIETQKNNLPFFTASFGVTKVIKEDDNNSVFIRVDKALYEAKVKRNDVVLISE